MLSKKDFVKINNYLWEIPKTYRKDMRVPARVYTSEKMLEDIFRDKSLEQLINLCCLPGIQKYGLAMPDCHEGYASPIGGVAAIRISDGIISPGMCLTKETKIFHPLGYWVPISEFQNGHLFDEITCLNFKVKKIQKTNLSRLWKLKANPSIIKVTTKTGRQVYATPDHPFYTPIGMRPLGKLNRGNTMAIYPYEGVPYKKVKDFILVTEKDIRKQWELLKQQERGKGLLQVINRLKFRNLLPLKSTSPASPVLLKIMGYLLGDGSMNFTNGRKRGRISFYGKKEDLLLLKEDLKTIGFTAFLQKRERNHTVRTIYREYQFKEIENSLSVTSSSLVLLLKALGIPIGNKVNQNFVLPVWIFKLPLWQKRLFLAAFFGAELTSPAVYKRHGFNFYASVLGINKSKKYLASGKKFLSQIAKLLNEFGVKTNKISQRKEQKNKNGQLSYRLRLIFSSQPANLINLWGKINYEYNQEKRLLANLAVSYMRSKQQFIKEKILSQRIRSRKGVINWEKRDERKLDKLIVRGGRGLSRPFVGQFPKFKEFIKNVTKGLGKSGAIWDEVSEIKKIPFKGYVYDFTVNHPDHNFVANNFVVSNCGYDINCGMKLLKSEYSEKDIKPYLDKLTTEIQKEVPSGLGRGRQIKFSIDQIDKILEGGAKRLVEQGYGEKEDIENCESEGRLEWANASAVSPHAKNRGRDQVGTLGSGNHFCELDKVEEIFDAEVAEIFGLFKDQIIIMIHCGSRGLGHQVCTDYLRTMIPAMQRYRIKVPDREFACVPFNSPEGQRYFSAMAAAANYAWANRQMIAHFIRKAWNLVLGEKASPLVALYDVAHNIIKKEKYIIDGKEMEVAVHRKGATRAFPPGHPEIPKKYQPWGQPVLIPGSMGTASYVLVGTKEGEEAFYSTCHGAGRTMSRHEAVRRISGQEVVRNLKQRGIIVKCFSMRGIAEEAPIAYKDIDEIVNIVHNAGLSKKVAKLKPLAVIKGE
ncbi:RNA-splicing ligase RtcB [bacterium (Candidatus Gribaldobacteria) CG10_big_fil_rev_8_21_14_0_10_33_41]|nr:MAG: RNA-splicing ligase RtcB [bacterium (Candidatus Gribaldobacteria) CG10_big_fil_rev_8_21_14_0_10_33_41]